MPFKSQLKDQIFKSGDIGLNCSKGFMANIILFMTSWLTKEANVSHAFNFVSNDMIVEATTKIKISLPSKYDCPKYTKVDIYRLPLSEDDRRKFRLGLLCKVNGAYGWFKIPLFGLDAIFTKITSLFGRKTPVFFFTKYFGIFNIPVCSQLVVYALHKFTSYELRDKDDKKVPWRIVSPDYLSDLLLLPHNMASLIYTK